MAWKVPIVMREAAAAPGAPPAAGASQRLPWLVKVTAVISPPDPPLLTSHAIRSTRVLVLPVPGPAHHRYGSLLRRDGRLLLGIGALEALLPLPLRRLRPLWELSPLFLPLFWGLLCPKQGDLSAQALDLRRGKERDGTVFPVKPGAALHLPQPQAPDALRHAGARFPAAGPLWGRPAG